MLKRLAIIAFLAPALLLAACNTTKGIGRDIKSVGDTIEDAAD